ncbi:recombinase family protein [Parasphingorhabdus sp.]|uniref:recombinase family protein n=1 Tax=Parasphingorhabdus sp. TaxID=2709688 RepID=UPI003593C0A6
MKRCYAYIRVSTLRQGEGVSLEVQQAAITDFASRQNLSIVRWFEEKETAAKCGRPIFTRMVKELRQGRADALIIHKLDRLTRNLTEYAKIGELIDAGVDVHTAVDSLDFRSRGGRLTAEIQAVIAADYVRNLREETLKGMNGRLKQGLYPFRAPIGYLDTGRGQPKTLDPVRAPLVRKAFELYATRQYSIKTLLPKLQSLGLTNRVGGRLSLHGVETLLNNPFYTGVIRIKRNGQSFPGVHERLISPALFERVQEIKSGKYGPMVTRHNHTYQGLFRCGLCNGPMVPERQKGTVYYRCPNTDCATKTVREDVLVTSIEACLSQAELTETNAEAATKEIERWVREAKHRDTVTGLKLRQDNLEARQHRLTDALVDGMIEKNTFNERQQALLLEAEALRQEQASAANYTAKAAHLRSVIELTKRLQQSHEMADRGQKRRIVEMTTSNRIVIEKNVYLEPQNWLQEVKKLASTPAGDPSRIEDRTFERIIDRYDESLQRVEEKFRTRTLSL